MVRLQIQLDPEQHRQVKRRARRMGVSVAEVIRRCVDAVLEVDASDGPEAKVGRALAVAGRYADAAGEARTAAEHDSALADSYNR